MTDYSALTKEICRATYPCGCAAIYSAMGHSEERCREHSMWIDFPHRISTPQFLKRHSIRGLHSLSGDVKAFLRIRGSAQYVNATVEKIEVEAAAPTQCCLKDEDSQGQCCCNCKFHVQDFHHCATTGQGADGKCVCSNPKGWICMPPEMDRAHSGWPEHGLCEMHQRDNAIEEG